jgi:hypothetical protein
MATTVPPGVAAEAPELLIEALQRFAGATA